MRKITQIFTIVVPVLLFLITSQAWSLDAPSITATAKGPNQVNLTWSAVTNPGYGYAIEIQSNSDSRYSTWTELRKVPYWVTESHYADPQAGAGMGQPCQYPVYGLKYGTTYSFRVRTYGAVSGSYVYGTYSAATQATTVTPGVIRYVTTTGAGAKDGTSWANAWQGMHSASSVAAGTLVLVEGGNYTADYLSISNSGSSGNKIVIQANPGQIVTITDNTGKPSGIGTIELFGSYIVIDGINMNGVSVSDPAVSVNGNRNAIVNAEIQNLTGWGCTIASSYNLIHNVNFHNWGSSSNNQGPSGVSMNTSNSNYNTIQFSTFSRIGHDTALNINGANHNRLLNNTYNLYWGMSWEGVYANSDYNLFEGNMVQLAGTEYNPTAYKPNIELSSGYNTVRRNVFAYGSSHALEVSSLASGFAHYNLVYNNVFYANTGAAIWYMATVNDEINNQFVNNIIYANKGGTSGTGIPSNCSVLLRGTYSGSQVHHNNILYVSGGVEYPNQAIINIGGTASNASVSQANATYSSVFHDNYADTPGFVNVSLSQTSIGNQDFHLAPGSANIGKGVSVVDTVWGTIGQTDIGAFRYYDLSGGATTAKQPSAPAQLSVK